MRILLDEDIPRRLAELLVDHEVSTVQRNGWSGIKNGELLGLAAARFDVFLTMDRNLEFQQNLATLPIAVLVVESVSNRMKTSRRSCPLSLMNLIASHLNRCDELAPNDPFRSPLNMALVSSNAAVW